MPKLCLLKNNSETISPTAEGIRRFMPFLRVLVEKGTIEGLEFEVIYYDVNSPAY